MKKKVIRTSVDGELYFTLTLQDEHNKVTTEFTIVDKDSDLMALAEFMGGASALALLGGVEIRHPKHFKACECGNCVEEED